MRSQPPHEPSELERLLLRAALLDGDEAVDSWERSKHVAEDVRRLDRATYRLLPQLYRNLESLGVDDRLMGTLKGVYRHSWYSNQRLFHATAETIRALESSGIETMAMKGAALSALHYRDPGARPMEDLDVLVRAERIREALDVLEQAGWRGHHNSPLELRLRVEHATDIEDAHGRQVDLHWGPLWEGVPEEGFWDRAVAAEVAGELTLAMCPTDALFTTVVHGLGWHPAPIGWISDSVIVVRAAGEGGIDWEAMVDCAERWSLTARLETGLSVLAADFAVPVPQDALDRLRRAPRMRAERAAQRALVRGQKRGLPAILHWDRYARLHRLGAPQASGGFPGYMRDAILWGSWLTPARLAFSRGKGLARRGLDRVGAGFGRAPSRAA